MTEQERIKKCHHCSEKCPQEQLAGEIAKGRMCAIKEVIELQKELEAYRAIGLTPEMIKGMIDSEKQACHEALVRGATLKEYQTIGTVEECRTAVERITPKKITRRYICSNVANLHCSNCMTRIEIEYSFCPNCGQAIDWSEEE